MSVNPKISGLQASIVKATEGEYTFKLGHISVSAGTKNTLILTTNDGKTASIPCMIQPEVVGQAKVAIVEASTLKLLEDLKINYEGADYRKKLKTSALVTRLLASHTGARKYPPYNQVILMANKIASGSFKTTICGKAAKSTEPSVTVLLALWVHVCGSGPLSAFYASLGEGGSMVDKDLDLNNVSPVVQEALDNAKDKSNPMANLRIIDLLMNRQCEAVSSETAPPTIEIITYKLLVFCLSAMKPAQTDYADYNKRRAIAFQGMYNANVKEADMVASMSDEAQNFYPIITQSYPDLMNQLILSFHGELDSEYNTPGIKYAIEMTNFLGMGTFRQILNFIASVKDNQMITKLHVAPEVVNDLQNFQAILKLKTERSSGAADYGTLFLRYGSVVTQSSNWPHLSAAGVAYGVMQDKTMMKHQLVKKDRKTVRRYYDLLCCRAPVSGMLDESASDEAVNILYQIGAEYKASQQAFSILSVAEKRDNDMLWDN